MATRTSTRNAQPVTETSIATYQQAMSQLPALLMLIAVIAFGVASFAGASYFMQSQKAFAESSSHRRLFESLRTVGDGLKTNPTSVFTNMSALESELPDRDRTSDMVSLFKLLAESRQDILAQQGDIQNRVKSVGAVSSSAKELSASVAAFAGSAHAKDPRWQQPLAPYFQQLGANALAPLIGGDSAAVNDWKNRVPSLIAAFTQFGQIAQNDPASTPQSRTQISEIISDLRALQVALGVASEASSATGVVDTIAEIQGAADRAARSIVGYVDAQPSPVWLFLTPLAAGVGLISVIGAYVIGFRSRRALFAVTESSRHSFAYVESFDRLIRQASVMFDGAGRLHPGRRLQVPEGDAHASQLAATVNRLADMVENGRKEQRREAGRIESAAVQALESASQVSTQASSFGVLADQITGWVEEMAALVAGQSERVGEAAKTAADVHAASRHAVARVGESGYRFDAIRTYNQDSAKRLKMLGEQLQSVLLATARQKGVARQISVIASNLAIEAAVGSSSEDSRRAGVLASEAQRMAHAVDESAQEISETITSLLADSSGVIDTLERSTADIVANEKVADDIFASVKSAETLASSAMQSLAASSSAIEGAVVSVMSKLGNAQSSLAEHAAFADTVQMLHDRIADIKRISRSEA